MIAPVAVSGLTRLADHPLVKARLAGLSLDARLRTLTEERFTLLQDGTADVAVFEHHWLGEFTAVVLDIDNDSDFAWKALTHLFANTEATVVKLSSANKDAGLCFGAYAAGIALSTAVVCPWYWQLDRNDFLKALEERKNFETFPEPTEAGTAPGADNGGESAGADSTGDRRAVAVAGGRRKQRAARV